MTKLEKEQIDKLVALRALHQKDKNELLKLYRKYVDKNAVYCLTCHSSVRLLMSRFRKWWETNTKYYKFIKPL